MAVYQAGYNFGPNDVLRFWDRSTNPNGFRDCVCHQVEIKLFKKPDGEVDSKLSYLILVEGKNSTTRVDGSDLYRQNELGQWVQGGLVPIYNAVYGYNPGDYAWVIDRLNNGVKYGAVYQTEIKVHKESPTTSHAKVIYYIRYSDSTGTKVSPEAEVFANASDAWAELGVVFGPTPTPTLPPDVTPLPGGISSTTVSKLNGGNLILYKGQPVYINQANGTVALVTNDVTILSFLGFVYDDFIPIGGTGRIITEGTINNTNSGWNNILEGGGTLMPGSRYYIASTGRLSAIAPVTGYSKQVGIAASDLELDIRTNPTIKL